MTIFIFAIGLSLLILLHELGHFLAAKFSGLLVHEFGFGFPPRLFKKKIGETVYSLNLLPFGGFVRIHGETRTEGEGESQVSAARNFAMQPAWRRALVLVAGVLMNVLAGWFIFSALFWVGIPQAVVVAEVLPNTPAAAAGFRANDVLIDFVDGPSFQEAVVASAGKETAFRVRRGEEVLTLSATPRSEAPEGEGRLGLRFTETGLPRTSFIEGFGKGFMQAMRVLGAIFVSFGELVKSIFTDRSALSQVVGPVGIFRVAAASADQGLAYLFQLIALISLNLAVLNVLPFPALDGGRLLFLLIEKIKGSPLSPKREQLANAIGFSLLIVLMVLVTVRDVVKLF